jgi:cell division protein FtsW
MVFSTTAVFSQQNFGSHTAMLRKHLLHIVLGLGLMAICSKAPLRLLYKISGPFFVLSLCMLAFVLIPGLGSSSGGAQRWLALGPLRLQPGEIVKLATVLFFASYMHRQQERFSKFKTAIAVPMSILAVVSLLLLAQPDFGSTAVISIIVFCQLFLAARVPHLMAVACCGGVVGSFLVILSPYRLKRLITFVDPFQDPSGAGYQLIQSLIAVGAEGVSGAGLGSGKQKLFYLPAAHTDFIFAVIAEELGLLGALFVLVVFLMVLWRGLDLSNALSEAIFPSALALGLTLLLVLPALLNMGVVLGLLPTKGLVLPLIAYGGTAMVVDLAIFGLLISLSRYRSQ